MEYLVDRAPLLFDQVNVLMCREFGFQLACTRGHPGARGKG